MEEHPPKESKESPAIARSACTECQRRKQKCNREWPCNHCQKRKVADRCRFNSVLDEKTPAERRRPLARQEPAVLLVVPAAPAEPLHPGGDSEAGPDDDDDNNGNDDYDDVDDADLEALGYSAAHFLSLHNSKQEKKPKTATLQYYRGPADCSQLEKALQVLPPRPYTDALVQNFVNAVNFHYYIIHPPTFLQEYEQWWIDRYQNRPLGLPWTSLFLMVCACSAQYPDTQLQEKLQRDLGQATPKLSEKYHSAGRELYHAIPVGNSHLYTVQQLLHSSYWFKSEARWVECWHALAAGIREAQELGIHQESIVHASSDFEREMRRRAWCLLSVWDWQVGALLSRPLILDPLDCDVQLPSLSLEDYSPSPILHLKLQADIIWRLSRRFGRPSNLKTLAAAEEYKTIVERWMQELPQPHAIENPDMSMDGIWPWIALHRHSLHTLCMSMVLDPTRPYLARPMSRKSQAAEQSLRRDGVNYALKLMGRLYDLFGYIFPRDAKFHAVMFFMFDTAALLCSAVLHDQDHSLPRRDECLKAIESALSMLKRLYPVAPSARKPYEMLSRLCKRLSRQATSQSAIDNHHRKRPRVVAAPTSQASPQSHASPPSHASPRSRASPGAYSSPSSRHSPASHTSGVSPTSSHSQAPNEHMPSHMTQPADAWAGGMQSMQQGQSTSPSYGSATFVPSPTSAISGADGSFILSNSPRDLMIQSPAGTAMPYSGVMMTPDDHFHDVNFNNISETDLGALAGLWNYSSLNLDYVPRYSGP